ncbi:DUF2283 domain-containing protein [Methanogenium sp. S4BF]|uniref:DUF2283 domain-containing protein n=1 Tax=Methanogenium sp. S4BF TaxID=1789226 RepID=UPI002416B943|nr:DUF2283 domain-containing protein [Methanogenium sp. S4BF]WFN35231.1 DUF2283 domain-containing protein [Methanogenium sp. S4BF]
MTADQICTDVDSFDYDYENDSLFIFTKGPNYSHSLNLDNIIIDFSEGNIIKGVEIQNASQKFGVSKYALKNPHKVDVGLNVSDEKIELKIRLTLRIRNKYLPKVIATTDMNEFNIPSGTMAMSCGMC